MIQMETDILIVGGGPVGMTLALTLRRGGAAVIIVDKKPSTRPFSQAAILWPRTLEILDLLGMANAWDGYGVPVHAFTLTINGESGILDLRRPDSPYPLPVGIGQDKTEAFLDAKLHAEGIDLRRSTEATAVQVDEDGASATLREADGCEYHLRARWIVGCEGSHSLVHDAAHFSDTGARNMGVQLVQGDVRIGGTLTLEPGRGYLWSGGAHSAMLAVPIHSDGHFRVLTAVPDDGSQDTPSLEYLQELAQQLVPGIALTDPVWLSRYRTQHRIADTFRRGRAFVAGDSAHVWVPVGGQGMNIGMQDAFDLGWKLAGVVRQQLSEAVLDTYSSERRPIGAQNITVTERLYGALIGQNTWVDAALRKLIPHALGLEIVDEKMAARFSELDFHYPPSLLASEHSGGHGLHAGSRAPDAWVNRNGQSVRLFDLFRSGRWTLLGWAIHKDAPEVRNALQGWDFGDAYLVDATPHGISGWDGPVLRDLPRLAASAYGVSRPCLHVIRPDGVIGWRGPADGEALAAFLAPLRATSAENG